GSEERYRPRAAPAGACLSVADGGDLPAAVGHGLLLLHDGPADGRPRVVPDPAKLCHVLLDLALPDAARFVAAPGFRGDGMVSAYRISGRLRPCESPEGTRPRGDLPARHPALLVER